MDASVFLALALACAPQVHADTARALVSVESAFNPWAIGVVGGALVRQPRHRVEALATAKALRDAGWNFSVGLGQINVTLAAVAVLGWNVLGQWGPPLAGAQLAQVSAPQVSPPELVAQQFIASGEPQVMIRDPQLDALSCPAHKQFGGASALQMPTGFLRNATFEGSAR